MLINRGINPLVRAVWRHTCEVMNYPTVYDPMDIDDFYTVGQLLTYVICLANGINVALFRNGKMEPVGPELDSVIELFMDNVGKNKLKVHTFSKSWLVSDNHE